MLRINDEDIKRYESDLKTFARRAYPFATKATINKAAFETRKVGQDNIREGMVTRNKFSVGSVRVNQARTLNVSRQEATVGSIAPYMAVQEFGGTKGKKGKHGVAIATSVASGEGEGAQPRKRLPRVPNRLANIALKRNKPRARSRKQENFLRIRGAVTSGRKFIFLDLQRHPGIYRVSGGKRRPNIKLMHDMSKASVSIPRNPWLAPATRTVEKQIPTFYKDALEFQLKRQGIFRP